jgi:hypothetical protein
VKLTGAMLSVFPDQDGRWVHQVRLPRVPSVAPPITLAVDFEGDAGDSAGDELTATLMDSDGRGLSALSRRLDHGFPPTGQVLFQFKDVPITQAGTHSIHLEYGGQVLGTVSFAVTRADSS